MGIVVKKKSTEIYGVDTSYFNENNKEFVVSNSIELEAGQTYDIGEGSVLIFDKDGGFTTDEENPATIVLNNTQIIAPMKQIFDTNVKIVGLMKNTEVYPEWFGAKGDGVTDDADAINAALYNAGHVPVVLSANNYLVKSTVGVKESSNVNTDLIAYYNRERDGKTAGTDRTALRWDADSPDYNMGYTIIVKHNLIGDESLNGTVLEMDVCEANVRVEGAIVVKSPSDNAIGFSLGLNGTSEDAKGYFSNVYINSITRDYNTMAAYPVTTSAEHCQTYHLGIGTGCMLMAVASNITINHIYGFKRGVWIREVFQTNNLNVGQVTAVYPMYLCSMKNGGYVTRNYIDVKYSQTDKGLGTWNGGNDYGTEWIINVADSSLIYEDFSSKYCEVAMNTWTFADDNKAPQCPQNYVFYYNRTKGSSNHTGNKYSFNISMNSGDKKVFFHQGTSSKSVDDEFFFGVNFCLSNIDVTGSIWNMKVHNIFVPQGEPASTRWGLITNGIKIDTALFTQSSAPLSFNNKIVPILYINDIYKFSGLLKGGSPDTIDFSGSNVNNIYLSNDTTTGHQSQFEWYDNILTNYGLEGKICSLVFAKNLNKTTPSETFIGVTMTKASL